MISGCGARNIGIDVVVSNNEKTIKKSMVVGGSHLVRREINKKFQ